MENNIRWLAILCLIGITSGQSSIPFTLWSHWQGGFVGETCFTAPVNMKGWIVSITFDVDVQKLSEIWNSELVEQVNQRLFIIKDVYYNKESTVGTRVCPGFKGLTNHNIRTTASIVFIPLFDDGKGVLPVDPTTSTAPIDATLAPPVEDTTAPPTEGVMPDDETTTEAENPSGKENFKASN
ncbi:hypothetical protein LOTGIDRAFT_153609 [Lottia gigantea]|uniref:CBM2 domain-containing protein n=1 Tax=Lottia gigantea TaxID=225164 RepID=V4A802_LOTGI|nr:hypothetical protein LOTGIDRAFT_153609 [Lottia gigantea]ESO91180.1 hypothetical protein LOTGIDRAFT_153609 [Lottia gigantea]